MASPATLARRELRYLQERKTALRQRNPKAAALALHRAFKANRELTQKLEAQDAGNAEASGASTSSAEAQTHEP